MIHKIYIGTILQQCHLGQNQNVFQLTEIIELGDKKSSNPKSQYNTLTVYNNWYFTILSRFIIKEPADGKWGDIVNGTWTGLIKELSDKVCEYNHQKLLFINP